MKNKLAWWGFAGLFGVAGIVMHSQQLTAMFVLLPLLLVAGVQDSDDFRRMTACAIRNSFVFNLFLFLSFFLFKAIVANIPMMIEMMQFNILLLILIEGLSWAFGLTLAVFVGHILIGVLLLGKKKRTGADGFGAGD